MKEYYKTSKGKAFWGDFVQLFNRRLKRYYRNKFQLIITSPPFPLNNKKQYGNLEGKRYLQWLGLFGPIFADLLKEDGSLVIELGNAWEKGRPVQSLLPLQALMEIIKSSGEKLRLIQEFIVYNPSRLPTPAQWVTVDRIRVVDSYTRIWWIAKSDFPKADNRRVLRPYSRQMKELLSKKKYNAGKRPSGHTIRKKTFLKNNNGSIPPNFLELEPIEGNEVRLPHNVLKFANTSSNDFFLKRCREIGIKPHPARMHPGVVAFFIEFLTDEGDLVLDPFAGSNTTGYVAEILNRRWISCEIREDYVRQSKIRFEDPVLKGGILK